MRRVWVTGVCGLLVACSGSSGDSGGSDGGHDGADTADAAWTTGTITVIAHDVYGFSPSMRISASTPVVFVDATDRTTVVTTDANGVASAEVTGPTTVTHVLPFDGQLDTATTIYGATPGDQLLLEGAPLDTTSNAPISVSFTPAASTYYRACTSCGCGSESMTSPVTAPVSAYCVATPMPVVLLARNGPTRTYGSGTTDYDPAGGGNIALAAATPLESFTGTFTNTPTSVYRLVFEFVAGTTETQFVTPPAMTQTLDVAGWRGVPGRFVSTLIRSDGATQYFIEGIGATTTSFSLDVGSSLLPWLATPVFDPSTMTLRVTSLPGGTDGDLLLGRFAYTRTNGRIVYWTVFASGPTNLVLPTIPASVGDMTPQSLQPSYASAFVYDSDAVDGYGAARLDPYGLTGNVFRVDPSRRSVSRCPRCDTLP